MDAQTGTHQWSLQAPTPTGRKCAAADIDGNGGDELIYIAGNILVVVTGDLKAGHILWTWQAPSSLSTMAGLAVASHMSARSAECATSTTFRASIRSRCHIDFFLIMAGKGGDPENCFHDHRQLSGDTSSRRLQFVDVNWTDRRITRSSGFLACPTSTSCRASSPNPSVFATLLLDHFAVSI